MGEEGVDLVGIRARAEGGGPPCGGQLEQGEKGVHMREEMVAETITYRCVVQVGKS